MIIINRKIKITALVLMLLAFLAALAILKKSYLSDFYVKMIKREQTVKSVPKQELAVKAEPSPYSGEYKIMRKAEDAANADLCKELKLIDLNHCLYNIANVSNKISFCEKIADEAIKKDCLELFSFREALQGDDWQLCQKLNNTDWRDSCFNEIFRKQNQAEICLKVPPERKNLCESVIYFKMAISGSDKSFCEKISEEKIAQECLAIAKKFPPDSDGDGLNDDYERSLSTNPFKADSDGDGMNDGEEIKAGRNPLIKGK